VSRPCSSHVYQVTPTPASCATSSRRNPGVRRRRVGRRPTCSGFKRSRRLRTKAPSSRRRSWAPLRCVSGMTSAGSCSISAVAIRSSMAEARGAGTGGAGALLNTLRVGVPSGGQHRGMTAQTTSQASTVEQLGARAWGMLLVLCGALFLDAMDVSMIGVALPSIREDLDISTSSLQWVVSAYVLGYGGFL